MCRSHTPRISGNSARLLEATFSRRNAQSRADATRGAGEANSHPRSRKSGVFLGPLSGGEPCPDAHGEAEQTSNRSTLTFSASNRTAPLGYHRGPECTEKKKIEFILCLCGERPGVYSR